jgi:NTE family protein
MTRKPRIGLALGSGSARGWSQIGVIRALERAGITADVVCGTSIGALVGAAYAAGQVDRLHDWVKGLTWQAVVSLVDLRMNGGLIEGGKLVDFFRTHFRDEGIERLARPFGCVATELATGREVWLREGPVIEAVRASIALPGLFTPVEREGRLLVDGGLVNPVPVSLCRAMGAEIVIAVDLNWDLIGRRHWAPEQAGADAKGRPEEPAGDGGVFASFLARWRQSRHPGGAQKDGPDAPSLLEVLSTSLNIMQVRITQSRLAGEPADVVIRPRLSGIAAMDYHRAGASIAEGERAAERALPFIAELLGTGTGT